ncbi:MAG: CDP-alcohol phosphatidyltransferase family protein [Terriglobia bacterium]
MTVAEKQGTPIRTAVILGAGDGQRLRSVANGKPKCLVDLLGLTLLERNLQALKQVGIRNVLMVVGYEGHTIEARLEQLNCDGITVRCLTSLDWTLGNGISLMRARAAVSNQPRFLVLMSDHLYEGGTLRDFLPRVPDDGRSHMLVDFNPDASVDAKDATYVCVSDVAQVCAIGKELTAAHGVDCGLFAFTQDIFPALEKSFAAGDCSLTGASRRLAEQRSLASIPLQMRFWQDIDTPADYQNAKKKLRAALASPGDGLIARYMNRKISRPITAALARTHVTPNQVTIVSFLLALVGALLFVLGQPLWAGLTVQLASIIDGVDGELARLKLKTSAWGTLLDSLLDRYADALILLAMGYYAYTLAPGWLPVLLTAAALLGVPLSMAFKDRYRIAFGRSYSSQADDGWARYLLPNRDGRLFVVMLGGVTRFVLPALAVIALVSHVVLLRRLWLARKQ